jgi:hypothetical protein
MHQVQLSDQLYQDAQRRAAEAGFSSVDQYVADVLSHDLNHETPNLDHFFTPERLVEIDQSLADVKAGKVLTLPKAEAELAKSRDAWLRDHPDSK